MVKLRTVLFYTLVAIVCLGVLFPLFWMISCSLKTTPEVMAYPPRWLPAEPQLTNYLDLWIEFKFMSIRFTKFVANSLSIAGIVVFLSLLMGSLGGYALARFGQYPGKNSAAIIILLGQVLPISLLLVPLYIIFHKAHFLDTHISLILSYTAFTLPFSTWILRSFFTSIPTEIDDAAMIDGCDYFHVFVRIILPLSLPGIAATAVFAFLMVWNEFMFASIFLNSSEKFTIPVAMYGFVQEYEIKWGYLLVSSVYVTIPAIVLVLLVQKHLVKAMAGGGVKM